jgi:hypothetical protein
VNDTAATCATGARLGRTSDFARVEAFMGMNVDVQSLTADDVFVS